MNHQIMNHTDLLSFDLMGELLAEVQFDDGDIIDDDTELFTSLNEISLNETRNLFSLNEKGGGVELGDDLLEDFVDDGRKNALVPVYE